MNRFIVAEFAFQAMLALAMWAAPGEQPKQKPKLEPVIDLEGIYSASGIDGRGKNYAGAAMIRRLGDTYFVQWACGEATSGIGVKTGDVLSVGWSSDGVRGCTVYKIQPGPKLVGTWVSFPGNGQRMPETLEFVKAFPKEDAE